MGGISIKVADRFSNLYDMTIPYRTKIFGPIAKVFIFFHISPNVVSYFGVLLMVGFVFIARDHHVLAAVCVALMVILDFVDGTIARLSNNMSDKGKFTDMLCDNINSTLFIVGIVRAGYMTAFNGMITVYVMLLLIILTVIRKNYKEKSDWLFHARAGLFTNLIKGIFYGLYLFILTSDTAYFDYFSIAASIIMGIKIIQEYALLQRISKHRFTKP